jgi:hypothetical protein
MDSSNVREKKITKSIPLVFLLFSTMDPQKMALTASSSNEVKNLLKRLKPQILTSRPQVLGLPYRLSLRPWISEEYICGYSLLHTGFNSSLLACVIS